MCIRDSRRSPPQDPVVAPGSPNRPSSCHRAAPSASAPRSRPPAPAPGLLGPGPLALPVRDEAEP
eukprot:10685515-Alexandrium_andersonii.AAC.1